MRAWWNRKSIEERRALIARRNPERVAAVELTRGKTRAKQEAVIRSQMRHPERHQARREVHAALARGDVARRLCFCGAARVEAHHFDYSRSLDIVWLCRRHHSDAHMTAIA